MIEKIRVEYPEFVKKKVELTSTQELDFGYEEAIKILRANIQFSGSNLHAIMITSSISGEGKSTTTLELAKSFANIGKRVLVIDADIRKSTFGLQIAKDITIDGLSQYLSAQKFLEDIIYESNIENLDIIFAGPYAPNPAELLEDFLFEKLIQYSKKYYDYIIIDTPPMFNLVDASIIAKYSDGVALVIESGAVSYKLIQKNIAQLEKSNTKFLGAILNKIPIQNKSYYGKYGKYSKYERE